MKKLSLVQILLLVLGVLSIVYGILYYLNIGRELVGLEVGALVSGVVVILVGFFLLQDKVLKRKNNLKLIYGLELVVWVVVALVAFIIPGFNGRAGDNVSLWVGLLLVVHSAIVLLLERNSRAVNFLHVLLTALGGYLVGSNVLNGYIDLTVLVIFVGFGLYTFYLVFNPKKGK